MPIKSTNITRVHSHVHLKDRWARHGHRGGVLWFTGLTRSGKTSLALGLEKILFDECYRVRVLHSQNFRTGLSSDLGFSREDRREHIRRVGEVAAFLARRGVVVVTSFISPFALDRASARAAVGEGFHEDFLDPGLTTNYQFGVVPDESLHSYQSLVLIIPMCVPDHGNSLAATSNRDDIASLNPQSFHAIFINPGVTVTQISSIRLGDLHSD